MHAFLDFEGPVVELESKIVELQRLATTDVDIDEEISRLQEKVDKLLAGIYSKLTPWQRTLVARHQDRPHSLDIIGRLIEDFMLLAGDRRFAEDKAIVGGIGRFRGRSVMVLGHEKGNNTQTRVERNFGMAKPEGYRKAVRLMQMADRFGLPVITFIDTPGAYPGVDAEERGQAEAIATAIDTLLGLKVPVIACVCGEGGSGGALALAAANSVLMFEHSIYSVISPEGCASILWHAAEKAQDAAEALKLTAPDLSDLGVIDAIVPEPVGGAHREPLAAIDTLGSVIESHLKPLLLKSPDELKRLRREKFLAMGRTIAA